MIKFLNTEACFLDDFAFNTLNSFSLELIYISFCHGP